MKVSYKSCVLFVKDMKRSREFYEGLMGLKVEMDLGVNVVYGPFALWLAEHAFDVIYKDAGHATGTGEQFELYFETDDVDALFEQVKTYGASFVHEILEQPWAQRVFRFHDPDGYVVEIAEAMDTVHRRLFKGGMTVAEISAKTFISEELVKADVEKH